jgi:hypothetical protein
MPDSSPISYVPTFPWKYFFPEKQERSEEIKGELFTYGEVPILVRSLEVWEQPRAHSPQENALVQGPPLQHSTHTQLLETKTKVHILAFRGTSICFNFTIAFESLVSRCVDYLVFWWDKAPPIKPNSKHPNLIITIREKNHHMLLAFCTWWLGP